MFELRFTADTLGERAALNAREERRSPETRVRTQRVAPRIMFELRFTADTLGERAALNAREERRSPETRVRTQRVGPRIVFELRFTADHIRRFFSENRALNPGEGAMARAALLVGDGEFVSAAVHETGVGCGACYGPVRDPAPNRSPPCGKSCVSTTLERPPLFGRTVSDSLQNS
jgi:hypothetical protein